MSVVGRTRLNIQEILLKHSVPNEESDGLGSPKTPTCTENPLYEYERVAHRVLPRVGVPSF